MPSVDHKCYVLYIQATIYNMQHVICSTTHVLSLSIRHLQPSPLFITIFLILLISKCIIPVYFTTFFLAKSYPCGQIVMCHTGNRTCSCFYSKLITDCMCSDAYYILIYAIYGSIYTQYITTSGISFQMRALWGLGPLCH